MSLPLTQPNPDLAAQIAATPPGMAHWAGSGPTEKSCQDCHHFMGKVRKVGIGIGEINPGRCRKYIRLMKAAKCSRTAPVYALPPDTPACSHFAPK